MPRVAKPAPNASTANLGFEAVARCEVRAENAERQPSRPDAIRGSKFGMSRSDTMGGGPFEADLADRMVAFSGQSLFCAEIPFCLQFLAMNKAAGKCRAVSELALAPAA